MSVRSAAAFLILLSVLAMSGMVEGNAPEDTAPERPEAIAESQSAKMRAKGVSAISRGVCRGRGCAANA